MPATFAFTLRTRDGLLTVTEGEQGVYVKNLLPGEASTQLEFMAEEMKAVYEKLRRMDFLALPTAFAMLPVTTSDGGWTGSSAAGTVDVVSVSGVGPTHSVEWTHDPGVEHMSSHPATLAMRELKREILQFLEAKPEYKSMPPMNGLFID